MGIRSYKDLEVWRKSVELTVGCYKLTAAFPRGDEFGLKSQIRRAVVSIPSNIAEGHARSHTKEFSQFLAVALGSLAEVETQMLLSVELDLVTGDQVATLLDQCHELGRMLNGLKRSVSRHPY